jgi:hypothetical protein
MTITTLLMILALAVGSGSSLSSESNPTTEPASVRPPTKIEGTCWINGVWYNPCPTENQGPGPGPDPPPQI